MRVRRGVESVNEYSEGVRWGVEGVRGGAGNKWRVWCINGKGVECGEGTEKVGVWRGHGESRSVERARRR